MKFLVNNIAISATVMRGNAFWKTWKPQYLRSGEEVDENSDSDVVNSEGCMPLHSLNDAPSTTIRKNS
jgi:hypothetical protein